MTYKEFKERFNKKIVLASHKNFIKYHAETVYFGKVKGNKFYIYYKKAYITNSFTTILKAKVYEEPTGCKITFYNAKSTFVIFFVLVIGFALINVGKFLFERNDFFYIMIFLIPVLAAFIALLIPSVKSEDRLKQKLKTIITYQVRYKYENTNDDY